MTATSVLRPVWYADWSGSKWGAISAFSMRTIIFSRHFITTLVSTMAGSPSGPVDFLMLTF